jgi:hypothetical protein
MISVNCALSDQGEKCCGTQSPAAQAQQQQPPKTHLPWCVCRGDLQEVSQTNTDYPISLFTTAFTHSFNNTLKIGGEGCRDNCLFSWKCLCISQCPQSQIPSNLMRKLLISEL